MNQSMNKILTWTIIIGFIVFVTVQSIRQNSEDQYLKDNPNLTTAKIIDWDPGAKGGARLLNYEFIIDNKTYNGSKSYYGLSQRNNYLLNKYFPVIYSSKDPNVNRLLIIENEFKEFGLIQPDSLKKYNDILK
jgi:hypothetical protein